MDRFKHILVEYFILFSVLAMLYIAKLWMYPNLDSKIFAFAIFIVYLRHHHLGSEVIEEEVCTGIAATKSVKRKLFYLLDIPTYPLLIMLWYNVTNFYWSTLIFVIWFIITDTLRVRYTIYGSYVSRWFYTSKININNKKWELHIADKDPFPSVPHMHALNAPLKLNIYTGEIYDTRNKQLVTIASKKDLRKLWSDKKFIDSVQNARQIYLSDHPKHKLPSIPIFS